MPHPFDIDRLASQVLGKMDQALSAAGIQDSIDQILSRATGISSYALRQAKGLAKQAAWIAEATMKGELEPDERSWFLDNLKGISENFARSVVALTLLTIEIAWNAIVGTIWEAINTALAGSGFNFSVPPVPHHSPG